MAIRKSCCAVVLAATVVVLVPGRASAAPCEDLAMLTLPDTTITLARMVGARGEGFTGFTLPSGFPAAELYARVMADVPAFCRVARLYAIHCPSGEKRGFGRGPQFNVFSVVSPVGCADGGGRGRITGIPSN